MQNRWIIVVAPTQHLAERYAETLWHSVITHSNVRSRWSKTYRCATVVDDLADLTTMIDWTGVQGSHKRLEGARPDEIHIVGTPWHSSLPGAVSDTWGMIERMCVMTPKTKRVWS